MVTITITLHEFGAAISKLTAAVLESPGEDLASLCMGAGSKCQQLAVAVLNMLRTTQHGKLLSAHVQSLSQQMDKATKHLNHTVKTQYKNTIF